MAERSREAGGSNVLIRLAALVGLTFWFIPLIAAVAQAQSPANLPAGVVSVEIDNQPIDTVTAPVTSNPTPEVSGRVDLGVPAIDLVVSGTGDVSVSAEVDGRGRFRVALPQPLADGQYSLALSGLAIGSFTVQAQDPAAAQNQAAAVRDPGPPLDITRVVPYPADFGNAIPGIGFLDGRFYTLREEATRTAAAAGDPTAAQVRDVERRLAESGWLQRYESRLAAPNADDTNTFSVQFSSFVVEYASGDAAQAAFQSLTSGASDTQMPQVGDASAITMFTGVTPDTGVEYQAARLVFRLGPMLVVIAYADLLNRPPDLTLLAAVAQSVAARGVIVAERGTVPLGSMILRIDPSSATGRLVRRDIYDVRAGTLTALYAEDDATRSSRIDLYTGTTDVFSDTTSGTFTQEAATRRTDQANRVKAVEPAATSVIGVEGETPVSEAASPTPAQRAQSASQPEPALAQVYVLSALFAFPAPADANSWLKSQREAILANGDRGQTKLTPVEEGPKFGDETYTFATQRGSGAGEQAATGFRMYTRVGQLVATLDVESVPGVQLNGVAQLMNLQLMCIDDGGCSSYASLPASVFGGEDPPVTARARRVETPTPAASIAPTPLPTPIPPPPTEVPPPPVEEVPVVEPTAPVEEVPTEAPAEQPPPEESTPPAEEPTAVPSEEPAPPAEEGTPPASEEPSPPPAEEPSPSPSPETAPPAEEPTVESSPPPVEEPTAVPTPAPVIEPTVVPTPAPAEEPTREPRNNDDKRRDNKDKRKDKS
jgi:hypothetical protein